jgi:GT2 family glycosyltransferase
MRGKQLRISVIIPVRPGGEVEKALSALRAVDYPAELIEVFVACGFNPSRQRNKAVEKARGEILYFLDNDSQIDRQAFRRLVKVFSGNFSCPALSHLRGFSFFPAWVSKAIVKRFFSKKIYKGEIGAVGGPNIWRGEESFEASVAGIVLESFFTHILMAARYRSIGPVHRADEKELILCNLAFRREVFSRVGGLSEKLYPNEENELLNRVEKAGYQLVYHPGILTFRPRRQSLSALLGAFFHYGRGRMEQIRVEGVGPSFLLLAPLGLLIYLLTLCFYQPWFAFLPLVAYFGLGFVSALGHALRRKRPYLAFFLPVVFLAAHLGYALGLIYGGLTSFEAKAKRRRKRVRVGKIKSFGKRWVSN